MSCLFHGEMIFCGVKIHTQFLSFCYLCLQVSNVVKLHIVDIVEQLNKDMPALAADWSCGDSGSMKKTITDSNLSQTNPYKLCHTGSNKES